MIQLNNKLEIDIEEIIDSVINRMKKYSVNNFNKLDLLVLTDVTKFDKSDIFNSWSHTDQCEHNFDIGKLSGLKNINNYIKNYLSK